MDDEIIIYIDEHRTNKKIHNVNNVGANKETMILEHKGLMTGGSFKV